MQHQEQPPSGGEVVMRAGQKALQLELAECRNCSAEAGRRLRQQAGSTGKHAPVRRRGWSSSTRGPPQRRTGRAPAGEPSLRSPGRRRKSAGEGQGGGKGVAGEDARGSKGGRARGRELLGAQLEEKHRPTTSGHLAAGQATPNCSGDTPTVPPTTCTPCCPARPCRLRTSSPAGRSASSSVSCSRRSTRMAERSHRLAR